MAPRPTVIGHRVIGVDLPAFLLSKNFYSESIGMPVGRTYDRAFNNSCTWQLLRMIALGLVWWDLSGRVARPRLPALLTAACAEFLLRVDLPCDLLRNFLGLSHALIARYYPLPQNKKP